MPLGRSGRLAMVTMAKADNRSSQLNPNNDAYWQARGYDSRPSDWGDVSQHHAESHAERTNTASHSNQLNPQHPAYYQARGHGAAEAQELASKYQNDDDDDDYDYYDDDDDGNILSSLMNS